MKRYTYTAINYNQTEVTGEVMANTVEEAMIQLKTMNLFPTRVLELGSSTISYETIMSQKIKNMNLSQALKMKNRLAGELVRQQEILQRENARRSDNVSKIDRQKIWESILSLSLQLGELKGKITRANVNIYPVLERMAELKSRISFLNGLPYKEGEEMSFVGRDQEKVVYQWNSFINQQKSDELVAELQETINQCQDEVDQFNATTLIEE